MTNRSSLSIPILPLQTDLTSSPSVYRSALKLVRRPLYPNTGSPRRWPSVPVVVRVRNYPNVKLTRSSENACRLAVLDVYRLVMLDVCRGVARSAET
jgi:hypothetical protein